MVVVTISVVTATLQTVASIFTVVTVTSNIFTPTIPVC